MQGSQAAPSIAPRCSACEAKKAPNWKLVAPIRAAARPSPSSFSKTKQNAPARKIWRISSISRLYNIRFAVTPPSRVAKLARGIEEGRLDICCERMPTVNVGSPQGQLAVAKRLRHE